MRKIKKFAMVCTFCFASALMVNGSLFSTSNVWKAIEEYSNPNKTKTEKNMIWAGETATGALATIGLAGTGITTGGAVFVGLAIAA